MLKLHPQYDISQAGTILPPHPQPETTICYSPDLKFGSHAQTSQFTSKELLVKAQAIKQFHKFSPSECLQYFQTILELPKLKANGETQVHCPFPEHGKGHGDKHPSLSINTAKGLWNCHAGCGGGGIVAFEMKFSDCDENEALKHIQSLLEKHDIKAEGGPPSVQPASEPDAIYNYTDEVGQLLFQVLRYPDKHFWQRRPNGKGGWIPNTSGVRKVLYCLPT